MGPKTSELVRLLEEAGALLQFYGEPHWSSWLKEDAARLKASDFRGIEHFFGAFGGMGSINDLVLHPTNGHRLAESEVEVANTRFRALLDAAADLAKEIRDEAVFE